MDELVPSLLRRKLLAACGSAAAASLLSGCRILIPTHIPPCVIQALPPAELPPKLIIDSHTHIFNGSDLEVRAFILYNESLSFPPILKKLAADLLQDLSWALAPSGKSELEELKRLKRCPNAATLTPVVDAHREAARQNLRSSLQKTQVYSSFLRQAATPAQSPEDKLRALTESPAAGERQRYLQEMDYLLSADSATMYQQHKSSLSVIHANRMRADAINGKVKASVSISGLLDFLQQGFQYRYVSVHDFRIMYKAELASGQPSRERSIDLMIANLVDYDWPLAGGNRTATSLRDQLDVMEEISVVTNGSVHGMVPYCPMRQVAMKAGKHPEHGPSNALSNLTFDEITHAVMTRGFLGIKMYPPMGFKPVDNKLESDSAWQQRELPDWMGKPVRYTSDGSIKRFAERLDDELEILYAWAEANDVPITAHSSASQGPVAQFERFAVSAEAWQKVLSDHPRLRINFGHTGDPSCAAVEGAGCVVPPDYKTFVDLFKSGPNAHSDLSYATGFLDNQNNFEALLETLYKQSAADEATSPADRFLYGTDWFMTLQEPNVSTYLDNSEALMRLLDTNLRPAQSFSKRFFGQNAVNWLGLAVGQPLRGRLETFYKGKGLDTTKNPPSWMPKV